MDKISMQVYEDSIWKFITYAGEITLIPNIFNKFEVFVRIGVLERAFPSRFFRLVFKNSSGHWCPYVSKRNKEENICWQTYGF